MLFVTIRIDEDDLGLPRISYIERLRSVYNAPAVTDFCYVSLLRSATKTWLPQSVNGEMKSVLRPIAWIAAWLVDRQRRSDIKAIRARARSRLSVTAD